MTQKNPPPSYTFPINPDYFNADCIREFPVVARVAQIGPQLSRHPGRVC